MESFNDLFKEFKERTTSPLFASFIIAWIFWNWKIAVSLIFDSEDVIKAEHYTSYVHYINTHIDNMHGWVYPLASAVCYILIYPPVRNLINGFITFNKTWGNNWNIRISDTRKIPASKFLAIKRKYDKQLEDLEKLYEGENEIQKDNTNLREEKVELQKQVNQTSDNYKKLENRFDKVSSVYNVDFLDGDWQTNFVFGDISDADFLKLKSPKGVPYTENIRIKDGRIFTVGSQKFVSEKPVAVITNFSRDKNKNEVSLVFKKDDRFEYHELKYNAEGTILRSKKDNSNSIIFSKSQVTKPSFLIT